MVWMMRDEMDGWMDGKKKSLPSFYGRRFDEGRALRERKQIVGCLAPK
jgi:hypothetical protein